MNCSVSISIVTYRPDLDLLARLLESIDVAIRFCKAKNSVGDYRLTIIDNSTNASVNAQIVRLAELTPLKNQVPIAVQAAERNLGYGIAHNRAISPDKVDYHLMLNPDVLLERNALYEALQFMEQHTGVGLLTPFVTGSKGERQYLCKRYPTVLDLFLRGFVPSWLRACSRKRLEHYEMRDLAADQVTMKIPIASGCFMLIRNTLLHELGGFRKVFFLYFEDFDLSLRIGEIARVAYVPSVRISHYGGDAARKGPRHIFWFIRSAVSFFNLHGWKWW